MRIEEDLKLDFSDVLIRPKRSTLNSRSGVDIVRSFKTHHAGKLLTTVPVMAANMDTVGTFGMARALGAFRCNTALHKHYSIAQMVTFFSETDPAVLEHVWISIGATERDLEKIDALHSAAAAAGIRDRVPDKICIDVANGYQEAFVEFVARFRDRFPTNVIMAGNVVTGDLTEQLILSGADVVKVGIGPGSVCTTRKMTGVGYPQLSAVIECADAAHGLGGLICSDGGCTVPGDLAKAIGGGADYVMLGGMFAGHAECEGEIIDGPPKRMKFYGMSSETAMEKWYGGVADYRASEGKTVEVPYRGPVEGTLRDILGGLRSAMTYIGAHSLKEVSKRTTFIRVGRQLNTVFGNS
jgi:GMP reductase